MNPFHQLQVLVALLLVLNVLDVLTTTYALRNKLAVEGNGIAAYFMHAAGCTWLGLLVLKVPVVLQCALAAFPQFFAGLGVPNAVLVRVADIPTWAWVGMVGFYAVVVGNNVRLVWRDALRRMEAEWSRW